MMDSLYMTYLEETEEWLQQAEECLIRLEAGYSIDDLNALFRIFHSVKGSSQMIGYEDIGSLTHKIEDMLDMVRKGRIGLDGQILQLCFSGLDHVKQLLESKKTTTGHESRAEFAHAAGLLEEEIDRILNANPETGSGGTNPAREDRLVSSLKGMKRAGANRYGVCISFSDDIPMVSPILFMIFNQVKDVGSLVYTNVSDEDLYGVSADPNLSSLFMIIESDLEEAELYTYFDVTYVEKIAISDLTEHRMLNRADSFGRDSRRFFDVFFQEFPQMRPVLFQDPGNLAREEYAELVREQYRKILEAAGLIPSDATGYDLKPEIEAFYGLCLDAADGKRDLDGKLVQTLRQKYVELFEKAYGYARGRYFYKIYIAKHASFMEGLEGFVERMDKSGTRSLLLDFSRLEMIHESELNRLIGLKRRLRDMGIAVRLIVRHSLRKRLVNIFDSIRAIEPFELFDTETDAALGGGISFAADET